MTTREPDYFDIGMGTLLLIYAITETAMLKNITLTAFLFMQMTLTVNAMTTTIDVGAKAAPWLWNNSNLNTSFKFGTINETLQQTTGPAIINGDSFDFTAGNTLSISYLSGYTAAFGSYDCSTFRADLCQNSLGYEIHDISKTYTNRFGTESEQEETGDLLGGLFPSNYVSIEEKRGIVKLMALMGVFTDDNGQIVDNQIPFTLRLNSAFSGEGGQSLSQDVIIPEGASQLQLGFNEDIFSDNTGFLRLNIEGAGLEVAPVPVPAAVWLFGSGLIGLVGLRRKKPAI